MGSQFAGGMAGAALADPLNALRNALSPRVSGGLVTSGVPFPDKIKASRGEPVRAINEARLSKKPQPVEVYHSTGADFTEFDPEKSIGGQLWFTSDAAKAKAGYDGATGRGRVVTANVDIRNPAGWDEYDKLGIDELMGRGYDGLKLVEADGEINYVAFFPEQVKIISNK